MTADPTPTPTPARPAPGGLVEFVRTQRANAAYCLFALAAAFLAATVWFATQGEKPAAGATPPTPPAVNPLDPDAPPPPAPELENPKKTDYRIAWIGTAVCFLICGGAGGVLFSRLPARTEAEQLSDARAFILVVGGLLGLTAFAFLAVYAIVRHEYLLQSVDPTKPGEFKWAVRLLLGLVAAIGVLFAAIQPARAEERNNQTLRRLVYGGNLVLTALLLLVALVILNVVASLKVPNTLDTTETGFYTLSNATKTTVARLPETVTAHVILPDSGDRVVNDIRQLLFAAQEASGGKLVPKFVSPVTNKGELQQLQEKYPKVDKNALGILLTAGGEESKRHEFIPANDLFKQDFRPGGGQTESFVGEGVLVQKLRFLSDADAKPVVYVTQGSGELALGGGDGFAKADRDMSSLKTFLATGNLDVRPLELKAGGKAEVPSDATVVIVADPTTPLPEPGVKALRDYMTGPKKGKMVLLADARPGGKDRKMAQTGLEGLASEFGVKLGQQFVYSVPIPAYQLGPKDTLAVFAVGRDGTGHALAQPFARIQLSLSVVREVSAAGANPGAPFQAAPLLTTVPGRPTWLEDEILDSPLQAFRDLADSEAIQARKQISRTPRTLGVAVTEGGAPPNPMNPHGGGGAQTPRLVVYAAGEVFSNDAPRVRGGGNPPTYELMAATIDWLRDRPPIAPDIEDKVYKTYTLPAAETISDTRLVWLPLGLAMIAIAGLGAGVWVIRRK